MVIKSQAQLYCSYELLSGNECRSPKKNMLNADTVQESSGISAEGKCNCDQRLRVVKITDQTRNN
ncbi:MAG: hypothetical protein ABI462_04675 [Ignavibacteria bacterium]